MVACGEHVLPSIVEMEALALKDAKMWDSRFTHDAKRLKGRFVVRFSWSKVHIHVNKLCRFGGCA